MHLHWYNFLQEVIQDILDKFDLSADDKNKVLNKIGSGGGGQQGSPSSNIVPNDDEVDMGNITLTGLASNTVLNLIPYNLCEKFLIS